jgi:hypothetical protein
MNNYFSSYKDFQYIIFKNKHFNYIPFSSSEQMMKGGVKALKMDKKCKLKKLEESIIVKKFSK